MAKSAFEGGGQGPPGVTGPTGPIGPTGSAGPAGPGGLLTLRVPINLTTPRSTSLAGNSFWSVLGLTDWDAGHWEFVKDVEGKVYGQVTVPQNLAPTPNAKIVLVVGANATSGVTRLQVGAAPIADAESMNPGSLTDETAQDITVPGTAYLRKDVEFDMATDPAAEDVLIVEVFHDGDHANDTLAVNTILWGAYLEVDVDAIGENAGGYETRSTNTILGVADNGKVIDITAAITQTLEADETLGDAGR